MQSLQVVTISVNQLEQLFKNWAQEIRLNDSRITANSDEIRLTQKQAALYLGISEVTLIDWKKKNKLPFYQLEGSRKVYFIKSELKELCQKNFNLLRKNTK